MWSYAELSQMAKAFGGPEKLLKALTKKGIEIGIKQARGKYILIGMLGGIAISGAAVLVYKLLKKDETAAVEGGDTAEQLLVEGIKAYDEEVKKNPDMEPLPEISREEAEAKIDQFVQDVAYEMKKEKKKKPGDQDDTECPGDDKPD